MSLRLSHKIYVAFVMTFFMILVLMLASIQFFAYRNFSDYINKMELETFDRLIDNLKEEFIQQQGWERVRRDDHA